MATGFRFRSTESKLPPNKALLMGMLFHELGTNAVKYGSLSNLTGKVWVTWDLESDVSERYLVLRWAEGGGPPVLEPSKKGFGTRMIERALQAEKGEAQMQFAATGLLCTMRIGLGGVPNRNS